MADTYKFTDASPALTAGNFALSYEGETTANLAYNADPSSVATALQALTAIGSGNLSCSGGLSDAHSGHLVSHFIGTFAGASVGGTITAVKMPANAGGSNRGVHFVKTQEGNGVDQGDQIAISVVDSPDEGTWKWGSYDIEYDDDGSAIQTAARAYYSDENITAYQDSSTAWHISFDVSVDSHSLPGAGDANGDNLLKYTSSGTTAGTIQQGGTSTVTLSLSGSPLAENGGVATVRAALDKIEEADIHVRVTLSGTALVNVDYSFDGYRSEAQRLQFPDFSGTFRLVGPAGNATIDTATDDNASAIQAAVDTCWGPEQAVVTGSAGVYAITFADASHRELGSIDTISGTGDDPIIYVMTDSAAFHIGAGNTDAEATITGLDDAAEEGPETVIVTIDQVTGGMAEAGSPDEVTATITDDEGSETYTGAGALTTGSPTCSGSGQAGASGSGSIVCSSPTCAGSAQAGTSGSGSIATESPSCSGSGQAGASGSAALETLAATCAASGQLGTSGGGDCSSGAATCSGSGQLGLQGTGATEVTTATCEGSAQLGVAGQAAIATESPSCSGSAQTGVNGNAAIATIAAVCAGQGVRRLGDTIPACQAAKFLRSNADAAAFL